MFYQCTFLIYILLTLFIPTNGTWMKKRTPHGFGFMSFYRNFPQPLALSLKNCSKELPNSKPEPCLGSCNSSVMWIEKNITKVLRYYRNLGSGWKVQSNQEIMLVPKCSCTTLCSEEKLASYKFTIINTKTGEIGVMKHTIKFCTKC